MKMVTPFYRYICCNMTGNIPTNKDLRSIIWSVFNSMMSGAKELLE